MDTLCQIDTMEYYSAVKKEQTVDTHNNLGKPQNNYSQFKKSVSECYITYDSIYMTFRKRESYSDIKQINGFQGLCV